MKSAGHGCLATADAMGAQATERWKEGEKAQHVNGLMRRIKPRKQRQKYKRKKTRSKVFEYFFEFLLSVERLPLVFTCTVA